MDCTQARTRGYIITLGTVSGMVGLIAYRRDVLRPSVSYRDIMAAATTGYLGEKEYCISVEMHAVCMPGVFFLLRS
jgi:hypothetical protein